MKIAALFVESKGPYRDVPGIDAWDVSRDARNYIGKSPVIAHPPCERWGRYWNGGPSAKIKRKLGDDEGCFLSALQSVCRVGGVLEHPEASHAYKAYDLTRPPRKGGWVESTASQPLKRGLKAWTCCVAQGKYGHEAQKLTWLFFVGKKKPFDLNWGLTPGRARLNKGYHSPEERARATKTGICQLLSKKQRKITPIPFRDLLIKLVKGK